MRITPLVTAAAAAALALLSSAAMAQVVGGTASPIDQAFATEASASNTFEIRSSRMALMKSSDPRVRDLARWMIDSHSAAEAKLQRAADYRDSANDAAPVVTPETAAMLQTLSGLDGAAFDEAYVQDQVEAHRMTARKLSDYRVAGTFEPLLAWDAATAPEVNDHLLHFELLAKEMPGA